MQNEAEVLGSFNELEETVHKYGKLIFEEKIDLNDVFLLSLLNRGRSLLSLALYLNALNH